MPTEIRVPRVGESITEVRLGDWRKAPGEFVTADETLLELESEKATFELSAPAAGRLVKIVRESGSTVSVDEVIALFEEGPVATSGAPPAGAPAKAASTFTSSSVGADDEDDAPAPSGSFVMPAAARALQQHGLSLQDVRATGPGGRLLKEDVDRAALQRAGQQRASQSKEGASSTHGVNPAAAMPTVAPVVPPPTATQAPSRSESPPAAPPRPAAVSPSSPPAAPQADSSATIPTSAAVKVATSASAVAASAATSTAASSTGGGLTRSKEARPAASASTSAGVSLGAASGTPGARQDEIVAMTLLRKRIAERLVHAKQTAALLTTFNEVDMSAVLEVRNRFKESFLQKHGVKLGFMSFFVRAAVEALRAFPAVNAEIRGTDIVYHHYCDIGVAIGGGKGLVVPVLRNAETMGFAEIERRINDFAQRAKDNALLPDDLQGGTFTISNGGVYGSMLSTPIVNPPQSGVLGMHAIQDRAVVVGGQIVVRPIMYLALTYDHRIVDGREAVTFLKRIKDSIEDPTRLMLEL